MDTSNWNHPKDMPLISVIIPVFNGEKTIKETIASVLAQTLADLEILVINDGSQDATLEIVAQISDPRLHIFSYPNSGVSASRNRGIAQAVGNYISFIDADDLWTPDKLATQWQALEANPLAAVAYSWSNWIDESGTFLRPGGHITKNGNVYADLLLRDFIESGSNPLIRRDALTEVGGFDESLAAAADWEMWLRLAARYQFVAVPAAQILYRVAPSSMSSNVWNMEAESLQIIEHHFAGAPESVKPLKRKVLASRYQYLTLKAIEGLPERRRGLTSARFFWNAIRHDPTWLRKRNLMLIILGKISLFTLLNPNQVKVLLEIAKTLRAKRKQ
jgi:glycosyltransferase involved in cell wall biosynthesis